VQLPEADQPTYEPREILLGPRAGAWYVVREGLAAGELVVTNGAFKIDAELQIRGRPSVMQPAGGPAPTHDHGPAPAGAAPAGSAPAATARPATAASAAPPAFQAQIGRLVRKNFEVVQALADDDPQGAGRAAKAFDETLHAIDPTLLTTNAQRREWNRLAQSLHATALLVATGADLETQRRHFKSFSATLIDLVRVFGVAEAGPVYRVMCPMVEGGEGFWLQPREDITNPYFGAPMLTCGELLENFAETPAPHGAHP
jgi:Cu(I)/Ag(I) efflux system membrane fusion protein